MPTTFAPVVRLLFSRRPAAISLLVIAVVVYAVDGVRFRRGCPHVGVESGETGFPLGADGDTTPSVFGVGFASLTHQAPDEPFTRLTEAVFALDASARFGVAVTERRHQYDDFVSAIAPAQPSPHFMLPFANQSDLGRFGDGGKASEFSASNVGLLLPRISHTTNYTWLRHVDEEG